MPLITIIFISIPNFYRAICLIHDFNITRKFPESINTTAAIFLWPQLDRKQST